MLCRKAWSISTTMQPHTWHNSWNGQWHKQATVNGVMT
jgi:hypothetical protein